VSLRRAIGVTSFLPLNRIVFEAAIYKEAFHDQRQ